MTIILNKALAQRVIRMRKNYIKRRLKKYATNASSIYALIKQPVDFEFEFDKEDTL